MNRRGCKIIKGRGISFADEKKVAVKGSEVNYSLQTIEKILAQKQLSQATKQSNYVVRPLLQQQYNLGLSPAKRNQEDMIDMLITPGLNNQDVDKHFIQQKRKKKRQSPYL